MSLFLQESHRDAPGQWKSSALGEERGNYALFFFIRLAGWPVEWCCHAAGFVSHNPWDHYFHTAAGLILKCWALELVISCHLGSMSRNFWRMLETIWWDACWLLCRPDHSGWTEYLLWFFNHLTGRYTIRVQPSQFLELPCKTLARIMLPENRYSTSQYTIM